MPDIGDILGTILKNPKKYRGNWKLEKELRPSNVTVILVTVGELGTITKKKNQKIK